MKRPLSSLQIGESGYISEIFEGSFTCKLLSLGFVPKIRLVLVRKSPLGDALYIKLGNHQLAVRKCEADTILVD